ncbi:MAG TPA: hypothetical protein VHV09_23340 [Trebonia sp.]|jgi:hypothetical protein|nr:hypothetical protein [Trebonia sp.]
MRDISNIMVTPAQLTASLASLTHGPYTDLSTAAAADLAAETIRYLNDAAPMGGITDPGTVAAVTANLATAAYRLPQLLTAISEWLETEAAAGRIADDHGQPAAQLTELVTQAAESADALAATLAGLHRLTATMHSGAAVPAA